MNMITLEIETALARAGIKARVHTTPVAGLDDRLADRCSAPQACSVRHRAAGARRVTSRAVRRGASCLPAVRQRRHRTDQRIRLDRMQVAAPLPRMPRTVRRLQVPLINREERHARDRRSPPTRRRSRADISRRRSRWKRPAGWCSSPAWSRSGRTARSPASATSRRRRARSARTSRPRWRPPAARSPMSAASMSMCATWRTWRRSIRCGASTFPSPPPASTLVEVSKFTHPDYLIEMSAIAVV